MTIVNLDDYRPGFTILATCVACGHRWMGTIGLRTSLKAIGCPKCGEFKSFAAFIPIEYLDEI